MTLTNENPIDAEPIPIDQILTEAEEPDEHPMGALLESESYELEIPKRGEIRRGTIARITETDVLVDVGAKSEGVIPSRELERLPEDKRAELSMGQEIDVYIVRSEGRNGTLILSLARAEEELDWREAEKLLESQDLFEGIVAGFNKGGLIIKLGHLRGFVPASQVSISRRRRAQGDSPDKRWGEMVDEPIFVKVIEVDRRRNRLILSERAGAREARDTLKERLITELKPGETRTGHIINLAEFGAFVDIGGADGLVHLSEISWKRISHPRDVLSVGQTVEVKVLGVDLDRKRISLSLRELEDDPWDKISGQFNEGQLVEGTITKLTKFGAFASILGTEEYDIEGLIHISELTDGRIEHPSEIIQEGQKLALRIIKIDRKRRRIGLSFKRVDSSEFAEQDWQAAMQDQGSPDEEGTDVSSTQEVEDFDAALDEEASERGDEVEIVEETAEELESGRHEAEDAVVEEVEEPIKETEEASEIEVKEELAPEESAEMVSETVAEEIEVPIKETEEASETEVKEELAPEESAETVSETVAEEIKSEEVDEAIEIEVPKKEAAEAVEATPQMENVEKEVDAELNEEAVSEIEVEEKPDIEVESHSAEETEIGNAEDDEVETE